jgi:hypothetical protein
MADVATFSTRVTITKMTPTIANRLVSTTVRMRAEPVEATLFEEYWHEFFIFANLIA